MWRPHNQPFPSILLVTISLKRKCAILCGGLHTELGTSELPIRYIQERFHVGGRFPIERLNLFTTTLTVTLSPQSINNKVANESASLQRVVKHAATIGQPFAKTFCL